MSFKWERLGGDPNASVTWRAKVIGGWLINNFTVVDTGNSGDFGRERMATESMVFIPDVNHDWSIE